MLDLVDSHCHLDFEPLAGRLPEVLANARRNAVGHMLCVAVNLEDFPGIHELAMHNADISASVGLHPNEDPGVIPDPDALAPLARLPGVVAIGETGLDYYRSSGDLEWQRERFRTHIRVARQEKKPLIVHSRDAPGDTLTIMREERADDIGGVMHCFSGDWAFARAALDLNFSISFAGIVTFRSAHIVQEVARKVPRGQILVETDAPYLAPVPHRGKTNEPAFVRHTAEFIAGLRGEPLEEFAADTTRHFHDRFPGAVQT